MRVNPTSFGIDIATKCRERDWGWIQPNTEFRYLLIIASSIFHPLLCNRLSVRHLLSAVSNMVLDMHLKEAGIPKSLQGKNYCSAEVNGEQSCHLQSYGLFSTLSVTLYFCHSVISPESAWKQIFIVLYETRSILSDDIHTRGCPSIRYPLSPWYAHNSPSYSSVLRDIPLIILIYTSL